MTISPRLDLTTARLLIAVADEGSIARAARRACIVPSAVSKRLSELEQRLGVTLLRRHRGGVELTYAGTAVLRRARNLVREDELLGEELRRLGALVQGHVRLCASESILNGYLPDVLRTFLAENPGIRVDLQERLNSAIVRALEDGEAELGIHAGEAPPSGLWSRVCHRDRLVAVMPRAHELARLSSVGLCDILDFDVIGPDQSASMSGVVSRQVAALGRPMSMRVRVDGFDVVCRLAQAGLGIGIVSESSAAAWAPQLGLAVLPIAEEWAQREHRICAGRPDDLSPAARLLLDHIVRSMMPDEPSISDGDGGAAKNHHRWAPARP